MTRTVSEFRRILHKQLLFYGLQRVPYAVPTPDLLIKLKLGIAITIDEQRWLKTVLFEQKYYFGWHGHQ